MVSTIRGGSFEPRRLFSLDQVLNQLSGDEGEVRHDEGSGESDLDMNSTD